VGPLLEIVKPSQKCEGFFCGIAFLNVYSTRFLTVPIPVVINTLSKESLLVKKKCFTFLDRVLSANLL
jgi:hypothetical protein